MSEDLMLKKSSIMSTLGADSLGPAADYHPNFALTLETTTYPITFGPRSRGYQTNMTGNVSLNVVLRY